MIRTEVLRKLDGPTLDAILTAQIEELTERRNVQDPALFKAAFEGTAPLTDGGERDTLACVENFSDAAGTAFTQYHTLRKQGAYIDNGVLVIPDAPTDPADTAAPADPADGGDTQDEE